MGREGSGFRVQGSVNANFFSSLNPEPSTLNPHTMDRSSLLSELATVLPRERLITDPAELFVYEADGFTIAKARPAAVCFPTSADEVASLMKVIAKHGAQIVPRGSGTGLTGGCGAFDLGVIISTAKMNRILQIDLENRVAHVEAGV